MGLNMKNFIKYKRIKKTFNSESQIQKFLDDLVSGNWIVINYSEFENNDSEIIITVFCGKYNNFI